MRKYAWTIAALFLSAALTVGGLVAGAETNQAKVLVDFEGLSEGSLVETLQSGSGITGDPVSGSIAVFGRRSATPSIPAAMIFDGACLPGGTSSSCTGQDTDLFFPTLGNLLIVSEDGDSNDPDDSEDGLITFDFSGFGDGSVHLESFVVMDTDTRRSSISWVTTSGAIGTQRVRATGNNRWLRVDLGLDGIVEFSIDMQGAGAIDELVLVVSQTPPVTTTTTTTAAVPPATTTTTTTVAPTTTTTSIPPTTTTTTTTTIPPGPGPAISMTHQANDLTADDAPGPRLIPGDTLTWSHSVTNTGTEDLWSLLVWHDGLGRADCPTRTLRVGDTVTCTHSATANADLYARDVDATAWASDGSEAVFSAQAHYTTTDGTPPTTTTTTTTTVAPTTTTTLPPGSPSLDMVVTIAGGATDTAPGPLLDPTAPVPLRYDITNSGGQTLYALFVWHDGIGRADCPDRTLSVGQSTTCTATTEASAGAHLSSVDAVTWDGVGARVAAGAQVHWYTDTTPPPPADPSVDLDILINGLPADTSPGPAVETGETVTIEYRATNTGGGDLWALWLWEPGHGRVDCPTRAIPEGGIVVCTRQMTAGPGISTGETLARAWDADGAEVEDVAEYFFFGTAVSPAVDIEVYVEGFDADYPPGPRLKTPGEVIDFSYVVTNTGQTPLVGIAVDDSRRGLVTCPRTDLGIGQTMTCTDTDITRWGNHAGTGTVVADAAGTTVTDSDPVHWHTRDEPRIHDLFLEASINGNNADTPPGPTVQAGRTIQIRYSIQNRGNTWMNEVTIAHPGVPPSSITCTGNDVLAAGQNLVCWATLPAYAGQYSAEVELMAWDNDGRRAETHDMVHYFGS